jgi:type I restriction enzyme, R subunit
MPYSLLSRIELLEESFEMAQGSLSNFTFLKPEWPDLYPEAAKAEQNALVDPRACCFYARRALELAVQWLYDVEEGLRRPYRSGLSALLFEPTFKTVVEPRIRTKMELIRKEGNAAVHRRKQVASKEAEAVLRELFHVLFWFARTYARQAQHVPQPGLAFDPAAIPQTARPAARRQTREALRKSADEQAARDEQLEQERRHNTELQAQIASLRKEIAKAKAANRAHPDEHDYDEEATRDTYIDLLLNEAGWQLDRERDREYEVHGMPNKGGRGYVDYVLWGADGKPLGLVEAKRTRRDPKVGRHQAKLYADCLEQQFGQRPVIFYSNGYATWLWDDERYPPRLVQGFYTRDELALLIQRRTTRRSLEDTPIKTAIVERPYQHRAIRHISEAFERDCQRDALIVMATGAGKTRTVIALIDVLMRAGWVKRALFLADRIALVNQTVGAFKTHLPNATTVNLVTEKEAEGRVYVSTYPTMMGHIGAAQTGLERRFGPGFFDLVVIDEAHRSVYQKYRAIFTYFDSLLVGLTATPKDEVDRNTYELFNLEPGVPTDVYTLDEAVAERFLVPPRAVTVPLKFPLQGIHYEDLSEAEQEQWEEQDWGDEEEIPHEVAPDAVNRWLFNADTVDKALETLMTRGYMVAGGDRLGKTIIFAKNTDHADFIAQRFDINYPEYAGHFAQVITHRTEYAQDLIDSFSVKDKAPHIAISVDMLDTGIDVPEVVNLVFFKPVRSRTKFLQMVGRGTRLCAYLFGPRQHKRDFYIFDCCDNIAFFNQQIKPAQGARTRSLGERLFDARLELLLALDGVAGESDGTHNSERGLREDTAGLLREQVAGMNPDNFLVRPHRRLVERYREPGAWSALDPQQASALVDHLSVLPTAVRDDDEAAKRFDLIMLRLQLCLLRHEPVERLRQQVQEIAAGLLEQTSIPAISRQQALLHELAEEAWWIDVTAPMLEGARRRLRDLVRLLVPRKRVVVYTNFADELGDVAEIPLRGVSGGGFERFREKARAYLGEHQDHLALQKLRRNKQLTQSDVTELERMLAGAGLGNSSDLDRARSEADGLGLFIRSLIGLERAAAAQALAGFIDGRKLSANQLDFIGLVVDHLTENGAMNAARLYESPFTDVAPSGPESLFPVADVDELVAAIDAVRSSAEPKDEAA